MSATKLMIGDGRCELGTVQSNSTVSRVPCVPRENRLLSGILLAIAVSCASISVRSSAQEAENPAERTVPSPSRRLELMEADIELQMRRSEFQLAELAVEEAALEVEKIKQMLELEDDPHAAEIIRRELQQAKIRVEMKKVHAHMSQLRIKLAKVRMEFVSTVEQRQSPKATQVEISHLDDSDVVVIRGTKPNVERIKRIIERTVAAKNDKE